MKLIFLLSLNVLFGFLQDENSLSVENRKNESQDLSLVELESLCFNEKLELIAKKEIPSDLHCLKTWYLMKWKEMRAHQELIMN